ncbi:MAG: CAP domain-containing protein [Rhodobacteraceae bacterium]|nr:CAP domain-containing protein [Paracoccaceae bacterium]
MVRSLVLPLALATLVAACAAPVPEVRFGPDGRPLPRVYRIAPSDEGRIQLRMLDSVNALRAADGLAALRLNSQLNAAAATHSRDMALQNRPWHFGSDGSSPIDRVQRTGYPGELKGELISETFETELETLAAWMEDPVTAAVILDPAARDMGFALFQEPSGKIWWTLVTGAPDGGGIDGSGFGVDLRAPAG